MAMTEMNVFLSATRNYIPHMVEVMASIRMFSKMKLHFWIFIDSSDIDDVQNFFNACPIFKTDKIRCLDNRWLKSNIDPKHCMSWTLAVFARLEIFNRFDDTVDRALFIDCDAFAVNFGLDQLYQIDFKDRYAAAVLDLSVMSYDRKTPLMCGVNAYFNMGCVLMNVDKIRKDNLIPVIIDSIIHKPEFLNSCGFNEQSIFNKLFHENIVWVDPKYNVYPLIFGYPQFTEYCKQYGYARQADCIKNTVVVHHRSKAKPWDMEKFFTFQPYQLQDRMPFLHSYVELKKAIVLADPTIYDRMHKLEI